VFCPQYRAPADDPLDVAPRNAIFFISDMGIEMDHRWDRVNDRCCLCEGPLAHEAALTEQSGLALRTLEQ